MELFQAKKCRQPVIGLVAPIGTDVRTFLNTLKSCLAQFSYETEEVKVTKFLTDRYSKKFKKDDPKSIEGLRLKITLGNEARLEYKAPDTLARYAATRIKALRRSKVRVAFVVSQLKRPEEVAYLRSVYGDSFFLIGIHSPEDAKVRHLMDLYNCPDRGKVVELMELDRDEKAFRSAPEKGTKKFPFDRFGQSMEAAYQRSDLFVRADADEGELVRFLDLLFSSPKVTPRRDEHLMFLAFAASAKSGDTGRQVGAVLSNHLGDVLGVGTNDVPKYGGGQYDPTLADQRDAVLGYESNSRQIDALVSEILDQVLSSATLNKGASKKTMEKQIRKKTGIKDLTEFMRAVHAEVESILQCARIGVSPVGATLFSTTFPCHNCAKHIVGAGIKDVYFVEPYAKSKAEKLHFDAIRLVDDGTELIGKVAFRPFLGIGPRRYFDLFSIVLTSGEVEDKRDGGSEVRKYVRSTAIFRFPILDASYKGLETKAKAFIKSPPKKKKAKKSVASRKG